MNILELLRDEEEFNVYVCGSHTRLFANNDGSYTVCKIDDSDSLPVYDGMSETDAVKAFMNNEKTSSKIDKLYRLAGGLNND